MPDLTREHRERLMKALTIYKNEQRKLAFIDPSMEEYTNVELTETDNLAREIGILENSEPYYLFEEDS